MFLIPVEECDKIDKAMNAFWWGNDEANKGIKWLSWERLCDVKEDGGWGFKKHRSFDIDILKHFDQVLFLFAHRSANIVEYSRSQIGNAPDFIL